MRSVASGKKFENKHIKDGVSAKIEINQQNSNGYNDFCEDSYLNSKYYFKKEYANGTIVDTKTDEHKKGYGKGKLKFIEFYGKKNDE